MDFINQRRAIDFLEKSVEKNKISHAYLFSGEKYSGKTFVALKFAEYLLCGKKSCGICDSCVSFKNKNHSDFFAIKKENEEIGVFDVRNLKSQFILKPFISGKKVAIIFDADNLTKEAQNSLLKILEECPAYGVIILICQNIDNILETIISRSVNVNLTQTPFPEIENKYGSLIADFSFGLVEIAEKMKNDKNFFEEFKNNFVKIQKLSLASDFEKLTYVEEIFKNDQEISQILKYWQIFLRSKLLDLAGINANYKINLKKQSDGEILELINLVKKTLNASFLIKKDFSANKQLILENLILNF